MRALLPSVVLLALTLAACGTPDPALPTLAPTLDNAGGPSAGQEAIPEATTEATTEVITASPMRQASSTPTRPAASATPMPQASSTPTRRPTLTPTPVATMTNVPTATPLSPEDSPTPEPEPEQADAAPPTPRTRPTVPPYDPASAFSAYGQVAPLAQDEHPDKQLFFISGEAQAGWTIGFIDPSNPEAQAIYQVAPNASVQALDLLVPLSGGLRPFSIDQARLDSPALAQRLSAAGFSPSSSAALIYTLQADARGLVWEVQDTESGQRLTLDARSGMIVP